MSKKRTGWTVMTEPEYNKIKQTLELGLTSAMVAKLAGRHITSIYRIKRTKDFADYQKFNDEHYGSGKMARAAQKKLDNAEQHINDEAYELLLERIKRLEKRVDLLFNHQSKKGWFRR